MSDSEGQGAVERDGAGVGDAAGFHRLRLGFTGDRGCINQGGPFHRLAVKRDSFSCMDHNNVSDPDVFPSNLVGIVQTGATYRCARQFHRFEFRDRGDRANPCDRNGVRMRRPGNSLPRRPSWH